MREAEERIAAILEELIRIPSPTGQEAPLQEALLRRLKARGFDCQLQEVLPGRPNLWARRGESPLLISAHVDTVPARGRAGYELRREKGGWLCGRGVLDVKGQMAALLWALEDDETAVNLLFTVDEEGKGQGSEKADIPPGIRAAVVLEPTGLAVAVAQAGALEVELDIRGKAAHAASPARGENAILKACRLLSILQGLPFLKQEHPLLGRGWLVPYWMEGGGKELYAVPERAQLRVDMGIIPPISPQEALKALEETLRGWDTSIELLSADMPFQTPEEAEAVGLLREAYREVTGHWPALVGISSWTDAEPLHRKGVEAVVFGAGDMALAHTEEEKVRADELLTLGRILRALMKRAAGTTR